MKKFISLISAGLLLAGTVSCGGRNSSSAPQVKTEIYGTVSPPSTGSPDEEPKENITLSYAVFGRLDPEEYELIKRFNESDNGYVIVTKDYSEIAGTDEGGNTVYDENSQLSLMITLMQDIASGEIDIVRDYYLGSPQNMDRLAARGAFIDLSQLMANDPEVSYSTLNSHVLELHESGGKLYTLPTYYTVDTLAGQSRYAGDNEGWTLDELISHWENMPEGATISGHTEKDYVYFTILRSKLASYIDYENAEVHFDSPEFIKTLEFCNTFGALSSTYSEPDPSAAQLVSEKRLVGFAEYHTALWNEEGQPVTLVGYPSDDGCGGIIDTLGNRFAISASVSDEERRGAWEFIRSYCLSDYQTSHYCKTEKMMIDGQIRETYMGAVGFPMNNAVYSQLAADAMAGKHLGSTISISGVEYQVGLLTQDELDRLTAYIGRIQQLSNGIDNDLSDIIQEEVSAYFSGEQTVTQCAELIQNRASILMAEKKQT